MQVPERPKEGIRSLGAGIQAAMGAGTSGPFLQPHQLYVYLSVVIFLAFIHIVICFLWL